jgi:SAM-dependent methyltransferase
MPNALQDVRRNWEYFGRTDPLWGVFSRRSARGGRWDVDEFFQTGHAEIDNLMGELPRRLPDQVMGQALDFGCGVGRLTRPLADHFDSVTGIDISAPMLEKAREYSDRPNVTYQLNVADQLSAFADGSFDFVLAHIVLQHMPPELGSGYLAEFFRVLRPGGGLVFTMPSMPAVDHIGGLAYAVLPRELIYRVRKVRDKAVMQMNTIRHDRMVTLLDELGFELQFMEPSRSASRNWLAFRYFARKPARDLKIVLPDAVSSSAAEPVPSQAQPTRTQSHTASD